MLRLADLTFPEIEALDRERTVVLFAVSPLEEHGPHLPVGTDLFHAEFFTQELGRRIEAEKPGWTAVSAPSVPVGTSAFDKAGTLLVRARTVRNIALDYGAALARHGFRYILLTNGHGGPGHIVALEEAAAAVSRRYGVRMLSVGGPVLWNVLRGRYADRLEPLLGRPLTALERDALRGDAHGGLWETSLQMQVRPDLVNAEYSKLPPQRFLLIDALRKNYPLRLGNRLGYIGSPAASSPEFGDAARRLLLDEVWKMARPVIEAKDESWQQTSFWYRLPFMRTAFPYVAAGAALILVAVAVWWWTR